MEKKAFEAKKADQKAGKKDRKSEAPKAIAVAKASDDKATEKKKDGEKKSNTLLYIVLLVLIAGAIAYWKLALHK